MNKRISEKEVISKIILPLLRKLDYDVDDPDEIKHEYRVIAGQTVIRPDIVVFRNNKPSFVVDGKNSDIRLSDYAGQVLSYGALLKVNYAALCNGRTFRCYDVNKETIVWDKPVSVIPEFLNKENMSKNKSRPVTQSQIDKAKDTLNKFQGEEFSALLSKCEDLIRDNDGLAGEDAFDQMSKILFMKMWYEKISDSDNNSLFSLNKIRSAGGANYVKQYLFDRVKKANPDLITTNDSLDLSDETILKLVSYLDDYTLLKTDIDVKGTAFELFLGRTLTGKLGQFFTPRTVVDFMVDMAEPDIYSKDGNVPYLILDPACGTGGFLISVYKQLCKRIDSYPASRKNELAECLAEKQIFGVDINPRLARVSKMNMYLHGDGHGGIYASNGLLDPDNDDYNEKFDLILTNPPFGNKNKDKRILKQFELGQNKSKQLGEVLFIERCVNCLRGGGCPRHRSARQYS